MKSADVFTKRPTLTNTRKRNNNPEAVRRQARVKEKTASSCNDSLARTERGSVPDNILQFVRSQEKNKKQEMVTPARSINAAVEMRLMNVTGFFPSLELNFYCWRYNGSWNLATVLLPDLGQLLLDELVQYPVLLADIVSHDGLER